MQPKLRNMARTGLIAVAVLLGVGVAESRAQLFIGTPNFSLGVGAPVYGAYPVYPGYAPYGVYPGVPVAPIYPTYAVRPYPYVYRAPGFYGPRPFYGHRGYGHYRR